MATLADRIAAVRRGETLESPAGITNAHDTQTPTRGVELVPELVSATEIAFKRVNVFRQLGRQTGSSGATTKTPCVSTRLQAAEVGESITITPTDPVFDQVVMDPVKFGVSSISSTELREDSDLLNWHSAEVAQALSAAVDDQAVATLQTATITNVAAASVDAVTLENVVDVIKLVPNTRGEKVWVMSTAVWAEVGLKLQSATGFIGEANLLGFRVVISDSMPGDTATASNVAYLADWEQALFYTGTGIRYAIDSESLAYQDEIRLYGTIRNAFGVSKTAPAPIAALAIS